MTDPEARLRFEVPTPAEIHGRLRDPIAVCLASAFGAGIWSRTPMPIGDPGMPNSARGIIAEFGDVARVTLASLDVEQTPSRNSRFLGCVIGGLVDEILRSSYGLTDFGARNGDGLLAYIAVQPEYQGSRVVPLDDGTFGIRAGRHGLGNAQPGESLAKILFETWLNLPEIRSCPRLFVRTRKALGPIQHLAEENGFRYVGEFRTAYHGDVQDRRVFRRDNDPAEVLPRRKAV